MELLPLFQYYWLFTVGCVKNAERIHIFEQWCMKLMSICWWFHPYQSFIARLTHLKFNCTIDMSSDIDEKLFLSFNNFTQQTLFFIFLQRLAYTQTLTTIFSKYHFFGYKWTKNSQKITNQDIKILFVASFSAFLKLSWTMANSISIKGELGPIFPGSVIYLPWFLSLQKLLEDPLYVD